MVIGRRRTYQRHFPSTNIKSINANRGGIHNPHLPSTPPRRTSLAPPSLLHQSLSQSSPPPHRSPRRSRKTVAGYYRLIIDSPPEFGWKLLDRCHQWEGEDGVIENIITCFDL
jgi:hypothetical protein